jgi:hypothetical protein
MNAMLPAHLTETLNNLGDAAKALGDEVRAEVDVQNKQNRRMIWLLLIVVVLVAGLGLQSLANRRLGLANANLNRQNSRIVERIESCTTVGDQCYEEGAKRTQGAIGELISQTLRVDIAVARCAKVTDTDAALEACVRRDLATPTPAPTPAPSPTPTPHG